GPDYPDIPRNHTTVELIPDNPNLDTSHTISPNFNPSNLGSTWGSDSIITDNPGSLANSNNPGGGGTRSINPNSLLITLDVDQFQPADMEAVDGTTTTLDNGVSRLNSGGNYQADGYVATAHVFVDSNGNGRFSRTDAYRDIQIAASVPADMKMTVVEPTVDTG